LRNASNGEPVKFVDHRRGNRDVRPGTEASHLRLEREPNPHREEQRVRVEEYGTPDGKPLRTTAG